MIRNIEAARLLLGKAEQDILILEACIAERGISMDSLGFHAQQAVEKSIKAVLQARAGSFPFIHDLSELIVSLKDSGIEVPGVIQSARQLTLFATAFRYTDSTVGDMTSLTRDDLLRMARAAVEWAGKQVG